MRIIYNIVGRVGEIFGNERFAYKMYLEGFRYSNRRGMED